MRVLHEPPRDEVAGQPEVDVATTETDVPQVGDHVRWRARQYEVVEVSRWYERYSRMLDYREIALALRLRGDDRADPTGVRELAPSGPGSLSSGAKALPPDDPTNSVP